MYGDTGQGYVGTGSQSQEVTSDVYSSTHVGDADVEHLAVVPTDNEEEIDILDLCVNNSGDMDVNSCLLILMLF